MAHYIDQLPPQPTGNPATDAASALRYLAYLQEQMNFIITLQNKAINGGAKL